LNTYDGGVGDDRDLAAVAAAIGHPARAAMLSELLGGREMAAGDLSRVAQVSPSTASAHLSRLRVAGLVTEQARGRHRYHRLSSAEVAQAIEALVVLAPARRVRSLRAANRLEAERAARSCYDHLAGALGVAVTDRLVDVGALARDGLALVDPAPLVALGVYPESARSNRRPLVRSCLDWSERRPHLAGGLGAALLESFLSRGWTVRRGGGRALAVTPSGRRGLARALDLDVSTVVTRPATTEG